MPSNRIWIDYDEDADVLYISFQKPQHADESEMKDNIIYHYRGKGLVGITLVGAKEYGEYGQWHRCKYLERWGRDVKYRFLSSIDFEK